MQSFRYLHIYRVNVLVFLVANLTQSIDSIDRPKKTAMFTLTASQDGVKKMCSLPFFRHVGGSV